MGSTRLAAAFYAGRRAEMEDGFVFVDQAGGPDRTRTERRESLTLQLLVARILYFHSDSLARRCY